VLSPSGFDCVGDLPYSGCKSYAADGQCQCHAMHNLNPATNTCDSQSNLYNCMEAEGASACTLCKPDFTLDAYGKCRDENCPEGCDHCKRDSQGVTYCQICSEGYWFDSDRGECYVYSNDSSQVGFKGQILECRNYKGHSENPESGLAAGTPECYRCNDDFVLNNFTGKCDVHGDYALGYKWIGCRVIDGGQCLECLPEFYQITKTNGQCFRKLDTNMSSGCRKFAPLDSHAGILYYDTTVSPAAPRCFIDRYFDQNT
jgi:hypothetical protein